jgi:uncharacterized repeat protein (TIGR03847 family)
MSESLELDPVDRITIAAVGEPGQRTFMLQARQAEVAVTLVIEKEQAIAIARASQQLLTRVGFPEPPMSPESEEFSFDSTLDPTWRVGSIEMGYMEQRDLVFLQCEELAEEGVEHSSALFVVTRAQLGALGLKALSIAASGRPRCPLCKLPMDPEGHTCPAMNGHGSAEIR